MCKTTLSIHVPDRPSTSCFCLGLILQNVDGMKPKKSHVDASQCKGHYVHWGEAHLTYQPRLYNLRIACNCASHKSGAPENGNARSGERAGTNA